MIYTDIRIPGPLGVGDIRHNPLAQFFVALFVIGIGVCIYLLWLTFTGATAHQRSDAFLAFFGVVMIGSIPLVLIVIFSRRYERIRHIIAHEHWARWTYDEAEQRRSGQYLPRRANEVYLTAYGIHWTDRRFVLEDFRSGLRKVALHRPPGEPPLLVFDYHFKRRSKYGVVLFVEEKRMIVPVPRGRDQEAEQLVERYQKLLGIPALSLNDEWRVAWIYGGVMALLLLVTAVLMFPLSSARIDEEFDMRATEVAIRRAADFAAVQIVFDEAEGRLNQLYRELEPTIVEGWRTVRAVELGLPSVLNIREIAYGRCALDDEFYFYAFETVKTSTYGYGDPAAFTRTSAAEPIYNECVPPEYQFVYSTDEMNAQWLYAHLQVDLRPSLTALAPLINMLTATVEPR